MAEDLRVDVGALRASVSAAVEAKESLAAAGEQIAAAVESARSGMVGSGEADHKVSTFGRQWRAECDLLASLLGACTEVLTQSADAYDALEGALATSLGDLAGG